MADILLADDDDLARGYLRVLLASSGHRVVEARDGVEAVARFRSGTFDLVVMDIYMPRMSGYDALLEMEPASRGVPVIALSGGGAGVDVDPLELARSAGACSTLQKPFRGEEFLGLVWLQLGRRPEGARLPSAVPIP
ncbi:MAG: response regulator [Planctomycetes bacterium]|nr:response regulator [Planctomycetota bacterium]